MDGPTRKTLKSLRRTRTTAQMGELFKAVRSHSDEELLADALQPRAHHASKADFAAVIAARLAVIHGPASDKADALIGVLEEAHGPIDLTSRGLIPVIRRLAKMFGEKVVAGATDSLLARLDTSGSMRERVT